MIDVEAIFKDKRLEPAGLLPFGFARARDVYIKEYSIMQGEFALQIFVFADGRVDYRVFDAQTKEEYFLARVGDATGNFVGEVHAACEEKLKELAQKCFRSERFQNEQTKRILQYVRQKYMVEPEFLWDRFPEFAVLRVFGKKPWFALVGRVEKKKFGLPEEGFAEVVNLKNDPSAVSALIRDRIAYPAYHMNKRYWFSVFADGSLPDADLWALIDRSYALADA